MSSYMLSPKANETDVTATQVVVIPEKETSILVERYPETETQAVSHKLDSLLKRINKRHDFNGSLLVAKNGKILYSNQIGYADFKKKEPIHEASLFQLASVSKQFTAAAIMLLVERNQIQLTDTVNSYFPDFPYENVTIKNLLNHTAGLPKYFWLAEHKWKEQKAPTNSDMMALFESSKVQRFFKPGRNFDYSNTGYLVLAAIIEKVSGISFSNFMQKNIFDPLGMKDSYVYSFENDSIKTNQLSGYRLYRGWRHLKINSTINDAIVGDKNVYATTEDLFKWTSGLNSGKLLSKESLDLMYTKGETVYGRKIPYGFGFRIDREDENIIYHHGKWNGFSTGLTQYLEDDLVVIVLEHTGYSAITSLNKKVKNLVVKHFDV
ncbi:serine hydrolase domain-containing protein [Lutibacter sp.]|uniref:serine hydrolase domain-containing protein n=1 Tax=Lutibacter sp. TaxID=1925666 RepID=UPI0025C4066B|nr:serine hydrolase domain-containing protein [Lutibacter sp.]